MAGVVAETFPGANGVELDATDEQLYDLYMGAADGSLGREEVEELLRSWAA